MKLPWATFSDTRHPVETTKISFPTWSTTEKWNNKSWHFIYRLQWNFHVRPSRIRDMLFKLLNLAFVLEVLLKTEPPNLGILYTDKSHMVLDTDYNETSLCDLLFVQTTKLSFPTRSTTGNWTTKSGHFRWIRKQVLLFYTSILTYAQTWTLYNRITFSLQLWWLVWTSWFR